MILTKVVLWINGCLLLAWLTTVFLLLPYLAGLAADPLVILGVLMGMLTIPFMGVLWGRRYRHLLGGFFPFQLLWYVSVVNACLVVVTGILYFLL